MKFPSIGSTVSNNLGKNTSSVEWRHLTLPGVSFSQPFFGGIFTPWAKTRKVFALQLAFIQRPCCTFHWASPLDITQTVVPSQRKDLLKIEFWQSHAIPDSSFSTHPFLAFWLSAGLGLKMDHLKQDSGSHVPPIFYPMYFGLFACASTACQFPTWGCGTLLKPELRTSTYHLNFPLPVNQPQPPAIPGTDERCCQTVASTFIQILPYHHFCNAGPQHAMHKLNTSGKEVTGIPDAWPGFCSRFHVYYLKIHHWQIHHDILGPHLLTHPGQSRRQDFVLWKEHCGRKPPVLTLLQRKLHHKQFRRETFCVLGSCVCSLLSLLWVWGKTSLVH